MNFLSEETNISAPLLIWIQVKRNECYNHKLQMQSANFWDRDDNALWGSVRNQYKIAWHNYLLKPINYYDAALNCVDYFVYDLGLSFAQGECRTNYSDGGLKLIFKKFTKIDGYFFYEATRIHIMLWNYSKLFWNSETKFFSTKRHTLLSKQSDENIDIWIINKRIHNGLWIQWETAVDDSRWHTFWCIFRENIECMFEK